MEEVKKMTEKEILTTLLNVELKSNARKLNFIEETAQEIFSKDFLIQSIAVLNELSIKNDELSKKQIIAISALLWTYKNDDWVGLKNYLILFLSKAGFGPSSIMIDKEYSHDSHQFSFNESILNQIAITFEQLKNEVKVGDKIFLLSDFQKEIWESIELNQLIGISAPTSAGKSFLILIKAIDLIIKKNGAIIYVVPTLSLVSQVLTDFRKMLDEFNLSDYSLESTYNNSSATKNTIYILTQERAIASFSQSDEPFENIRLLVIDEIQNVEKVADSDDHRSKVLFDLMIELRNHSQIDHIIISGPRINKIDELGTNVFGIESDKKETNASPVLNLTYSISKTGNHYYFNAYTDLLEKNIRLKITNNDTIEGYGRVMYNNDYLSYLSSFINKLGPDESNLIFSPTTKTCEKISTFLSDEKESLNDSYTDDLAEFISSTVSPRFTMVDTVRKGVAYHHGKLPFHVRLLIEDGIKQKKIKTIICTTTLLQGVNLPVQNIIIRNPNLFVQRRDTSAELSKYEIANLRGRAGRLLKDFIGRTFILDELSFNRNNENQSNLFEDSTKELKVGYGEKYLANKEKIQSDIINKVGATLDNIEYSFLTTYIRQTVFRYGLHSQIYLSRVGIDIDGPFLNRILESLSSLNIDRSICAKNRYWDPIDLNALYLIREEFDIPTSAQDSNISYTLKNILLILRSRFPIYYYRYFGVNDVPNKDVMLQKCILAENWLKEKTLFEIFSNDFYDSSEKISETISFVQNKISYGLPLLLKPLYDILSPDGMFTRFIEIGAYQPVSRKLIELNIPRETALYLKDNYEFTITEEKQDLITQIRTIREDLSYWHKIQLQNI